MIFFLECYAIGTLNLYQRIMDSMPSGASQQQSKPWMIASVVLFIALIAVIVFFATKSGGLPSGDGNSAPVLKADTAASDLVTFINKIYAQQVGTATLKSVTEESGLYKVTVGITANGQPVDQEVYVTRDGKLFIPQIIKVDEVSAQYEQYQQQQQAAPTTGEDTNTVPVGSDTATNTDPSVQ